MLHVLSFACVEQALFFFCCQTLVSRLLQLVENPVYLVRLCLLAGVVIVVVLTGIVSVMHLHLGFPLPGFGAEQGGDGIERLVDP